MNAIVLWVFVPIGVALFLFAFQDRKRIITFIGAGLALVLAAFAWVFPVGKIIRLGSWNFEVTGQFFVYGRQILITPEDMPILIMLYLILAVWFLGSLVANTPSYFVSIGMIILALLVTAMSIEPFFYAAILFEFVVLLFVVLLSAPERSPTKGVIRFLIFQTLGMLFILFAGWLFSLIDIDLVDGKLFSRSLILMAIGFAFLLGIFHYLILRINKIY